LWIDAMTQSRQIRSIVVVSAAVVLLGGGAVAAYLFRPPAPPPLDAPLGDLIRFAADERFAALSPEEKKPYVDFFMDRFSKDPMGLMKAANDAGITEEQRRLAMRQVGPQAMNKRLDEYFDLPPGKDRTAYLDKMIDEQERMGGMMRKMRNVVGGNRDGATSRPSGRGRGDWNSPAVMKQRIEDTPPHRRTQMAEFIADIRQRRQARGLPDPHGPR